MPGKVKKGSATMSFDEREELVKGMAGTVPGLDDAQTEKGKHRGDAVILQTSSDKKTVLLSQLANKASTTTFTSRPPEELLWTPATKPAEGGEREFPLKFEFSPNVPESQQPY